MDQRCTGTSMLRYVTRWGFPRPLPVRARWDRILRQRGRLPLVLFVGTCLLAVSAAVSAADTDPGLRFAPGGHWVANPALDLVFHVNGGARTVDAQAQVDGIETGSQVVQGETSGYVVGEGRIVEFGKSTLTVEQTLTVPTGERPVALEASGGPYLVYREAGSVVRLGESPATIPAGGPLGEPVTTPDGTLWVHHVDSGQICKLARATDRLSCPATAPTGSTGVLTIVREHPVFVDTTADTMSRIGDDGLGRPTRLGVEAPPTARVAPVDVDGRVALLDPEGRRLHLVDGTTVGTDRENAAPVTVPLPEGAYTAPSATKSSVVLLDKQQNVVLTYSGTGKPLRTVTVPSDAGEPSLNRGGDGRVYVDGTEGRHVLVVDDGGGVGQVPVTEVQPPSAPATSPPAPTPSTGDTTVPPTGALPTTATPSAPGVPLAPRTTTRARPRTTTPTPPRTTPPTPPRTTAATPPRTTPPALPRTTPPAATTPTITVSRGPTEAYGSSCPTPDCGLMRIVMRGFKPNTTYHLHPYSEHESYTNPGADLTTDGAGNLSVNRFHFGEVGLRVWVTAGGVRSNQFRWVSG